MIVRYASILIRALTIFLYPYIYTVDGIFSITIIGYFYTFLIAPVQIYSQYSVYNEIKSIPLKKGLNNNTKWFLSIIFLSFVTRGLINNPEFIFNQIDTLLIFSTAFLLKENSEGYYKARKIEMYKYANYMQYLVTPIIFLITTLILFSLKFYEGSIYSISTFLSFLMPYFIIRFNKKIDISLENNKKLFKELKIIRKEKNINKRVIFSTILIYLLPAFFFIMGGRFFGNEYKQIFIALFFAQKLVDFISPGFNFFENMYPYKIKKVSRRGFSAINFFVGKVVKLQFKLNIFIVSMLTILLIIFYLFSKNLTFLDTDVILYTLLFSSTMLTINCYQGHDLVISSFSPNALIKIDFLVLILALVFLSISIYYSLPTLIIVSPLLIIFLRRILSVRALKLNIF